MDGPGVVSALNIQDAETYANYLSDNGVPAKSIHSGMRKDLRQSLLQELEAGSLKCLVHVSLLAEGVDMPWLRWLCLRRPVGARVRFVQEVGRVLRCNPGKEFAYIIDPHDLFGTHSLSNPEKLGEVLTREEKEYEDELVKLTKDENEKELVRKMPTARAFNVVDSYIANLLSIFRSANICKAAGDWDESDWRGGSPTEKQLMALQKVKWSSRYLPKHIREPFKLLIEQAHTFNKGTVNDLLSILFGLASASSNARKNRTHYFLPALRYPRPDFPIQTMLFVMNNH
jgi:hypothetical protein